MPAMPPLASTTLPASAASMTSGTLRPFLFDNIPVRGKIVRLENVAAHIPSLTAHHADIGRILADMLVAAVTFSADIQKTDVGGSPQVTLQIHNQTTVPLLVAQSTAEGFLKAYASTKYDQGETPPSYADIAHAGGLLAVSVDYGTDTVPVQSVVKLNDVSLAASIEQYFNDSVQLQTYFRVFAEWVDGTLSCAALFLQALPDARHTENFSDDWHRLHLILETLTPAEILPSGLLEEELLFRLFAEDTVRVFPPRTLVFGQPDVRARMMQALKSIGEETCLALLAENDGVLEMTCEFSGTTVRFTEEEVRDIFSATPAQ